MNLNEYWWRSQGKWTPKIWWDVWNSYVTWHPASDFKFHRRMAGITQKEVAARLGTKQPDIARFERGRENISIARLRKFANAIGCVLFIEIKPLSHAIKDEYQKHQLPMKVDFTAHGTSTQTFTFNTF